MNDHEIGVLINDFIGRIVQSGRQFEDLKKKKEDTPEMECLLLLRVITAGVALLYIQDQLTKKGAGPENFPDVTDTLETSLERFGHLTVFMNLQQIKMLDTNTDAKA